MVVRYLIDTHIFIWADSDPQKLSPQVRSIIQNPQNQIYLSTVSLWEMQIKHNLGKLELSIPLSQIISDIKNEQLYNLLDIQAKHILSLEQLPDIHKDPFDRLLIAQANTEHMILITDDTKIVQYPVNILGL